MVDIQKLDDSFSFAIISPSGGLLLQSECFENEQEAQRALALLQQFRNKKVVVFDRRTNHEGKFLFQMKKADGQVLGKSQLYDSEPGMENGIKNLKRVLGNQ